jgi:SAM-dependent methyltransferase
MEPKQECPLEVGVRAALEYKGNVRYRFTLAELAALARCALLCAGLLAGTPAAVSGCAKSEDKPARVPDVQYDPSPREVVSAMLELAAVRKGDVVYDLGCGDGRIVIEAVRRHGATGVCVDIDPVRIREARANAERAGVAGSIRFETKDLFEVEIGDATVVALFLWPSVNQRLRPKLERELRPGTRVVSHWHDMGAWKPDQTRIVDPPGERERPIYLWVMSSP